MLPGENAAHTWNDPERKKLAEEAKHTGNGIPEHKIVPEDAKAMEEEEAKHEHEHDRSSHLINANNSSW
jgi:hypothetical protein